MNFLAPEKRQLRKLNLGCGHDLREGYINVDLHERHNPDLVADITNLQNLPSGHFDEIVAQDVLEHLERAKVPIALQEWSRLLANNGTLRIRVPSLVHMEKHLCIPENQTIEKADEIMHMIFGTQAYNGDYHLAGFTPLILKHRLQEAGMLICEAQLLWGLVYEVVGRKCNNLSDAKEIVHNLYYTTLNRPVDPSGLDYFTNALNKNQITIDQFLCTLKSSDEYKSQRFSG